jgi:CRISPR-associated protein Csx10
MIIRYYPYVLRLAAQAAFPSVGGEAAGSETMPFVPGSVLRGAVARTLGDPAGDSGRQAAFDTIVLGGSVRYLNAYPRVAGERALPTPICFRIDKDDAAVKPSDAITAWDRSYDDYDDCEEADRDGLSLKRMAEPFVTLGARSYRVSPKLGGRVHQQRDRARGMAWEDKTGKVNKAHGTIFPLEYIEPEQEFEGLIQILGSDENCVVSLFNTSKQALSPPILLGRSRRACYGGDIQICCLDQARRQELTGHCVMTGDLKSGSRFRVLLLSDYAGRNEKTGQVDPAYLADDILHLLGSRAKVVRRFCSYGVSGGFNRKWRLEIPQSFVCKAGSVIVFEALEDIPYADYKAIEDAGIGHRLVEGFGRIAFLAAGRKTLRIEAPPSNDPGVAAPPGNAPDLVLEAEWRVLKGAVEREIAVEASRLARAAKNVPSSSLIGRLRGVLMAEPNVALTRLQEWIYGEALRRPALNQLRECLVGENSKQSLAGWILDVVGGDLGQYLTLDSLAQRRHIVSEESALAELAGQSAWIRARLVDETLAAIARNKRDGGHR